MLRPTPDHDNLRDTANIRGEDDKDERLTNVTSPTPAAGSDLDMDVAESLLSLRINHGGWDNGAERGLNANIEDVDAGVDAGVDADVNK